MTRRATVVTTHGDADQAAQIAAAIAPDNTAQMETTADGETVRTTVERAETGSLHATVDDYVVNLAVADNLTQL